MGTRRTKQESEKRDKPGGAPPLSRTQDTVAIQSSGVGWSWRVDGVISLAAMGVAFAVYANSLSNGFVYDDVRIIKENQRLESAWSLGTFFRTSYWGNANDDSRLYRPLTIWSFAVDRAVFGPGPFGVHLMNVLSHAVLAGLVYVLIRYLLSDRVVAVLTALCFGLHPIHTEVVANGAGRGELGAALFGVLALHFHLGWARRQAAQDSEKYISGRQNGRFRSWGGFALCGAWLLFFIGLLFKESIVMIPALVFLGDWLLVEQGRWRGALRRAWSVAMYAVPLGAYLAIRMSVIGSGLPAVQEVMAGASRGQRALYGSETVLRYIGQLLVPWNLCAEYSDYTRLVRTTLREPLAIISVLHWLAAGILFVWLFRTRRFIPLFGIAAFYLLLLPTSNIIISIGTVRADRLLFLPSLGFALALAWALGVLFRRQRTFTCAILLIMLSFYAWRTVTRNADWRSTETLWMATIRQNPGSAVGWGFVGDVHRDRGEYTLAESAYRRSFELRDAAGFFYPESHNNYAKELDRRGDRSGAAAQYRLVVAHNPNQYTALVNLAEILLHDGNTRPEAITLLQRACTANPAEFRAPANLSAAYQFNGDFETALRYLEAAIRLAPLQADLWRSKAEVLIVLGRPTLAADAKAEADRLNGLANSRK